MGTVLLRSHDCLTSRFPHETLISPSRKHGRNPNRTRSARRKRSPSDNDSDRDRSGRSSRSSSSSSTMVVKFPVKNLVMGQVKILKRGDETEIQEIEKMIKDRRSDETKSEIDEKSSVRSDESDVFSTERLGPEPEMIPKGIRLMDLQSRSNSFDSADENFAGSGFVVSPSPRSLPVPSFFNKKASDGRLPVLSTKIVDDTATKTLRRLLRLDLLR